MKRFYSLLTVILFSLLTINSFAQVEVVNAYPNLNFSGPIDYQFASQSDNLVYVAERKGRILVFENDSETSETSVFLDIASQVSTSGEGGLLGFDFHPNFESNGYFYVYYTASSPFRSVISRFEAGSDVENSESVIMEIDQPHSNHNGGQIRFGPGGYLFIALGDGGSQGDPDDNGEDRTTLLGSILRIDVDNTESGLNYGIPGSNPYVGNTEGYREEIYAYGFRNPYRFSFNGSELWVADVGQSAREEINVVKRGRNYGWNTMEGSLCYDPSSGCDTSGKELPVYEYGRDQGGSVTGGFVYGGSKAPELDGRYVYADFVSGKIWSFDWNGNTATDNQLIDTFGQYHLISFGEDQDGELYLGSFDGKIYTFQSPGTHGETDNTPPQVQSLSPSDNEGDVEVDVVISASFSEALDPATVSVSTFLITQNGNSVSGSIDLSGSTVSFTPNDDLPYETEVTALMTTGVKDEAGNRLPDNYEWSFVTMDEPDSISPEITSTSPAANEQDVAVNSVITATFSEAMNGSTINTSTIIVNGGGTVSGSISYSGNTVIFTPNSDLKENTAHTVTITTGVEDLSGNALESDFEWSFTTLEETDTTPPQVQSVSPSDEERDVDVDVVISASFSEALDPASVNASTFMITQNGNDVSGSIDLSGSTVSFTPNNDLLYEAEVNALITTGVTDEAGNNLSSDYEWNFIIMDEPDITAPEVISASPAANEQNVDVSSVITATFSEAMNGSTITASTILVTRGSNTVSGSVSYSDKKVTFTPNSDLQKNTTYSVTITTGVEDVAGNALGNDYEWSFTTKGETTVSGSVNDLSLRAGDQLNQGAEFFEVADITALFSGGTPPFDYSVTENSNGETVSVAVDQNNKLTVTATGSGINQKVADVTINAIDTFNSSASLTFQATTSPAYGDVNANGEVNSSDASSILQAVIEAITFTETQSKAGDVNEDNNINSFDASITFRYGIEFTGFTQLPFSPSSKDSNAKLVYGDVAAKDGVATIPVMIEGNEITALDFIGEYNLNQAKLQDLTINGLPSDWMIARSTDEEGKVKFALAGITPLSSTEIATITFKLNDNNSDIGLRANGSINNVAYAIDELSVKEMPQSFTLEQNYPNPFNPTTQITYQLAEAANIELSVFNMLGQKIRVLESTRKTAGSYTVTFDASALNSGVYVYQLKAGQAVFNRKLMLIK